jgi:hypothetical protein
MTSPRLPAQAKPPSGMAAARAVARMRRLQIGVVKAADKTLPHASARLPAVPTGDDKPAGCE